MVCRPSCRAAMNLPSVRSEGCGLLLIIENVFTLIPGYLNYENRGQMPLLLVALLPLLLTLPLLFTLLKFVEFVTDAPRSQKLFAANL